MTPGQIPQVLVDILDERAGKVHSATGPVMSALAEILTEYGKLQASAIPALQQRIEALDELLRRYEWAGVPMVSIRQVRDLLRGLATPEQYASALQATPTAEVT